MPQLLKHRLTAPIFAGVTVLLNICWPLAHGHLRAWITIAGVLTFFAASVSHSHRNQSQNFTRCLLMLMPLAFLIEAVGVHTSIPFGHYIYGQQLGPCIANVPLIIPFAWVMMLYPTYLASRFVAHKPVVQVLLGAWLMASWDLYLDPQMIREGYWTWFTSSGAPTLVIPLTNFVGWYATSIIFMWLLRSSDSHAHASGSQDGGSSMPMTPAVMLAWVWLGSFVANVLPFKPYLDRPAVAVSGLIGMGAVLVPWSWRLWSKRS